MKIEKKNLMLIQIESLCVLALGYERQTFTLYIPSTIRGLMKTFFMNFSMMFSPAAVFWSHCCFPSLKPSGAARENKGQYVTLINITQKTLQNIIHLTFQKGRHFHCGFCRVNLRPDKDIFDIVHRQQWHKKFLFVCASPWPVLSREKQ